MKKPTDYSKYQAYIASKEWKRFRVEAILHANGKCCQCGNADKLRCHHKNYKNLFHETFDDVMVVCENCHNLLHGGKSRRKQPRKNARLPRKQRYAKLFRPWILADKQHMKHWGVPIPDKYLSQNEREEKRCQTDKRENQTRKQFRKYMSSLPPDIHSFAPENSPSTNFP